MTDKRDDDLPEGMAAIRDAVLTLRRRILPKAAHLDEGIHDAAAQGKPGFALLKMVSSHPYRKRFGQLFAGTGFGYPARANEHEVSPENLQKLFDHTAQTWGKLGEEDAAWSVLSDDRFKKSDANVPASFYASGEPEVKQLFVALARNGITPPFRKAVEYGCGIGRVSVPLSKHCDTLHAYDISKGHLAMAETHAQASEVDNIVFTQITTPDQDIEQGYDLYYSFIVFQHNSPPIMKRLVRQAIEGLAPGGVAVFHLPVFIREYEFRLDKYLAADHGDIEMHALPQRVVLDIIQDSDCRLIDLFEVSQNVRNKFLMNVFTVQKPH